MFSPGTTIYLDIIKLASVVVSDSLLKLFNSAYCEFCQDFNSYSSFLRKPELFG